MNKAVNAFAEWLGTLQGVGVIIALTLASLFLPTEIGTYWLSILAILYPAALMKRDHDQSVIDKQRDEAMHDKLDELIRAIKDADDSKIGEEKNALQEL